MSSPIAEVLEKIRERLSASDVAGAHGIVKAIALEPLRIQDYQKIVRLIDEQRDLWREHLRGAQLRLAILGGYTTQPIRLALRTGALSEGYLLETYEAEYNTYRMSVLDPSSELYGFRPELVLFATSSVNIEEFPRLGASAEEVDFMVQNMLEQYESLWATVRERTGAVVLQHNFEPIEGQVLGRLEGRYIWSRSRFIQRINEHLWELDGHGVRIIDVCGLASRIGSWNWFDPRFFQYSKHAFSPNCTFEYVRLFAGLFRSLVGKPKKCLVVDLDNTLWGGIVGDDGLDEIQLGNGSAQGEAFLAFCHYIKLLKERGVILAVNSKNDPETAAEVFRSHPQMPLKIDDFAAFYCNWESKAANLRAIADELNIDIDSLVFVDDNPVECAQVRSMEPSIMVIEMTGDPAYFIRKLEELHLFDQLDLTREDFNRPRSYAAQCKISELRGPNVSLEEFLTDLNMTARVEVSAPSDLPRIEQLFKKTNQFNLTARRYDQTSLLRFLDQPDGFCLSCRLRDRFADYGVVAAVVGSIHDDWLFMDNWVMSCRVFARTFEEYIFNHIKNIAQERNCSIIRGEFIPSAKNAYVANLYPKLGFSPEADDAHGHWVLNVDVAPALRSFIRDEKSDGS